MVNRLLVIGYWLLARTKKEIHLLDIRPSYRVYLSDPTGYARHSLRMIWSAR